MGFLDLLFRSQNRTPTVTSILPDVAIQEIRRGRLPQLNTDSVFLRNGEYCHYIDKAIMAKEKTSISYSGSGYSVPGLFKGHRMRASRGRRIENVSTEYFKGILYITNKRVIFQAKKNGFDKQHRSLSAIKPYSNGVELQYGNKAFSLLVYDGDLVDKVLKSI